MKYYLCPRGDMFDDRPANGRCPVHKELLTEENDGAPAVTEGVLAPAPSKPKVATRKATKPSASPGSPRRMESNKTAKNAAKKKPKGR